MTKKIFTLMALALCFAFNACDQVGDDPIEEEGVDISLNKEELILEIGQSERLVADFDPVDAPNTAHTWSSGDSKIASVDETGNVTGVSVGETTVAAKALDGGKTATCRVTIVEKFISVTGITLDQSECTMIEGDELILVATVKPSNASKKAVNWSSDNKEVAVVSTEGRITAIAPGEATITATTEDGEKTASCKITVIARGAKISEAEVTNITSNSALVTGYVEVSGVEVSEVGLCWATTQNPTIENQSIKASSKQGVTYTIRNLSAETTYYVRLYAVIDGSVKYGNQNVFATLPAVDFDIPEISDIAAHSAVVNGIIHANGSELTETGVVFGTSSMPTVDNSKVVVSDEDVKCTLYDLQANTRYYVRLYAVVNEQFYYGDETDFRTNEELIVKFAPTDYYEDRLILKAKAPKGYTKVEVCYNTKPNPKITDNIATATMDENGDFVLDLPGLTKGTTYYIRPYSRTGAKIEYHEEEVSAETLGGTYRFTLGKVLLQGTYVSDWDPYKNCYMYIPIEYGLPEGTYAVSSENSNCVGLKNSITGEYKDYVYITGGVGSIYLKVKAYDNVYKTIYYNSFKTYNTTEVEFVNIDNDETYYCVIPILEYNYNYSPKGSY